MANKIARTQQRIADLLALDRKLQSLYVRMFRVPASECGHIGGRICSRLTTSSTPFD